MTERAYIFTRGADTVHVTVDRREANRARARLSLVGGGLSLAALVVGMAAWPFLIVTAALVLFLVGRLASIEQDLRDRAEREAERNLARFESDRWQALRALGGTR